MTERRTSDLASSPRSLYGLTFFSGAHVDPPARLRGLAIERESVLWSDGNTADDDRSGGDAATTRLLGPRSRPWSGVRWQAANPTQVTGRQRDVLSAWTLKTEASVLRVPSEQVQVVMKEEETRSRLHVWWSLDGRSSDFASFFSCCLEGLYSGGGLLATGQRS